MNRIDDPTTLAAQPPRHVLESDSEEDDDPAFPRAGGRGGAARPKPGPVEIVVQGWEGERDAATLLVVGGEEAGKWADGFDGRAGGSLVRVDGGQEQTVGLISHLSGDVVMLLLRPDLPHAVPAPLALAALEAISPARVIAVGSYVASSYLPALDEQTSEDEERLRFLATSPSFRPEADLYPFSPPNHLLSPLALFLTLIPLSDPPTPLFLLPGPRPTLATLRKLAGVVERATGGGAQWDERRFVHGGRVGKWGRKEVDVSSMYM